MANDKGGDGKTNPFGDGDGAPRTSGRAAADMITDPTGGPSKGSGTGDVLRQMEMSLSSKVGENPDKNADSVAKGGDLPFDDVDGSTDMGEKGVGSVGMGRKPFSLKG